MPVRSILLAIITLAAIPALAIEPPAEDRARASHGFDRPGNYCIGGMQDRKIIPFDGRIERPFRQTTRLGCEADGGRPTFLPDLHPPVRDGVLA